MISSPASAAFTGPWMTNSRLGFRGSIGVRDGAALWALLFPMVLASVPAAGGEANVVAVDVTRERAGTYRFDVTVRHADEGWKHYADRWDVLAPDGTVLGTRVLLHPHVNEQPFTRSLSGVTIPDGIR